MEQLPTSAQGGAHLLAQLLTLNPEFYLQVTQQYAISAVLSCASNTSLIVLNKVGIPLEEYVGLHKLFIVVMDAFLGHSTYRHHTALDLTRLMIAHEAVWLHANILHRDINDGNMVIYQDPDNLGERPRGLLIDWDLCKYKSDMGHGVVQVTRSVSLV